MPTVNTTETKEADDLAGATDHLEQAAADIAREAGHSTLTDEDRRAAYEQARKTSPPAKSSPPTPDEP